MSRDLCSELSWVPADAFQESDRAIIVSLKSEIVHARDQLKTLFREARASASLSITASQFALSGAGIATIPCAEAVVMGGSMILGGAFGTFTSFVTAREKNLQHRELVQRLAILERELHQALGNAMAGDIRLRALLEEEIGILYADMG